MQMKNLLRLMCSLTLTTVATTSVVACGDQTAVNLDTVLKKKELGPIQLMILLNQLRKNLKKLLKQFQKIKILI